MSGPTELYFYPILALSVIAAITDFFWGRIYNWLTLPAIFLGMIAAATLGGWWGIGNALLGIMTGFLLYGWMFWLGHMGAGDVKLLMALGAWGGFRFSFEVGIFGILVGGVIAFLTLLFLGRLKKFTRKLYIFIVTLFIKELSVEMPEIDKKLTMPYGVPIAVAAIWVMLGNPLERWGVLPWH